MTKDQLRLHYIEKRKLISPGQLSANSEKIINNVLSNFQMEKQMVSLFLPIERKKEINTYSLWEKINNFDGEVAVPLMNPNKGELKHLLLVSHSQLAVNSFGIPEPQNGKVVAAHKIDIVFVPLLAYDVKGNRVGYGGGYYDRFLKKCNPKAIFIGLSLFPPEEKIDDLLQTDVPLHACITPEKVYRF